MTDRVDLFGDPVPENHGRRGRPAHAPSQRLRDKVSLLLSQGWSNERIANAIGISLPVLRRCYRIELKQRAFAADRRDARLLEVLFEGVNAGKVPAIKLFLKMVERNDMMLAEQRVRERGQSDDRSDEKLGKKAQRLENAKRTVSEGRFAVPPAPRLVQ